MILKTLVFFSIFLVSPTSLADHQIWCQKDAGNYRRNSTFHRNLAAVLSTLTDQSFSSSFSNATAGAGSNTVYALFSCRADVTPVGCNGCVSGGAGSIQQTCPFQKEAIMWDRQCTLRYANRPIFALFEEEPHAWWCSHKTVSMDPTQFNGIVQNGLESLVDQVVHLNHNSSSPSSLRFFGAREVDFGVGGKVRLQVQCTPDINPADCDRCLMSAMRFYQKPCDLGKTGAMVALPSCQMEYRTTSPSAESAAPSLPQSPPPLPRQRKNHDYDVVAKVVVPAVVGLLLLIGVIFWMIRRKKFPTLTCLRDFGVNKNIQGGDESQVEITDCLNFDLQSIETATKGFSLSYKLGEGGFGIVYQGVLENGERVAVKRLSQKSVQGSQEFKTEVAVVAKLQHKNLVRLVGFCVKGEERLLVYEFMPNLSLDRFLFDSTRSSYLTWPVRLKIITGIARGLQYLHEDSRVTIVHRDLKASNILLDDNLEPKIADFGMARLVKLDQTSDNTSKVVGTYGYMAPEYVSTGRITVKSDVYSFGAMILEILSGKSNTQFYQISQGEGLLRHARRIWGEDAIEQLMDPVLENNFSRIEAQRCLQIGLLCVQQDESNRPLMNAVLLMLGSNTIELPSPVS